MSKPKQKPLLGYKSEISQPIPLQQKCLKRPHSIFPLIELPEFRFTTEEQPLLMMQNHTISNSIQKTSLRSVAKSPRKRLANQKSCNDFMLKQTELNILFEKPIYAYSKRLSKVSNKNFSNLKVFPQESQQHPPIYENLAQFYQNQNHEQNLSFESRFESGNLAMATKFGDNQYLLLLTKDFNTARCTQWFFFRVLNRKPAKCTFHILNFFKNYSSFQCGMQVCVAAKSNNFTWSRGGSDVLYRKTNLKSDNKPLFCLSFSYDFKNEHDATYFSYSYPYTYARLDRLLFSLQNENQSIMKRRSIGTSLGGNSIDMLTISNFRSSQDTKKLILITCRVHPGQTPGSFVMQGLIHKLLQQSEQMQTVREKFIFKLIPMLNPDGVINGNYRCSLSGYDMNRERFPEIHAVKRVLQMGKKPFMFIDLHAHSKKKGVFMYGCSSKTNPFLFREVPFLLWKNINQFNYYQCSFSTSNKQKQGTMRMGVFREYSVLLSYTMESSFCGPLKARTHFTVDNYLSIGENLAKTLGKYCGVKRKSQHNENELLLLEQLYSNKQLLKVGQHNPHDSSSDSELEAGFQVDVEQQASTHRLNKPRLKPKLKIDVSRQHTITTPRDRFNNFMLSKTSSLREKACSEMRITLKTPAAVERVSKIGMELEVKFKRQNEGFRAERGYNGVKSQRKKEEDVNASNNLISPLRYPDDQITNLTNLFLPSVTSSSYKKYNKPKTMSKGLVHVGRKYLQNAGLLKDEIRSSVNKKKIDWRGSGNAFLI